MPNLSNLEIDVANLVSFEFCARELIANFEHVRSLAEMSIEGDHPHCMFVQNINDHPHLNLRGVSFIGF